MTEVLQLPSPSSCSTSPCVRLTPNDVSHQTTSLINNNSTLQQHSQQEAEKDQLSILTLLIATFRKSLIACSSTGAALHTRTVPSSSMEIGWPSDVRHVAHVTFDRFHGFLGLPVEFEPEVPRRPPSARFLLIFISFFLIHLLYSSFNLSSFSSFY